MVQVRELYNKNSKIDGIAIEIQLLTRVPI
jgi:hypothetical protein